MKFEDASERTGTLSEASRSCAFADIENDGNLDLFVCAHKGPNRLFRQCDDGTFSDIAVKAGAEQAEKSSLGVAFGDINGDGRTDLYVANYVSQADNLFLNTGGGGFRDVSGRNGIDLKASSLGAAFGDVDDDGDLDLFVTISSWLHGVKRGKGQLKAMGHAVEPNQLYINRGKGRFARRSTPPLDFEGLAHDICLDDLDQDGDQDLYVAVDGREKQMATSRGGNPCYRNEGNGKNWREVSEAWGLHHVGNCVCAGAADFDNDGDLDILLVNFDSDPVVLRNNTDNGDYLKVKVAGTGSNRSGIGARVRVRQTARTRGAPDAVRMREIQSSWGYCKSGPLSVHFGVDRSVTYDIEVTFPATGAKVIRRNVRPPQALLIREQE